MVRLFSKRFKRLIVYMYNIFGPNQNALRGGGGYLCIPELGLGLKARRFNVFVIHLMLFSFYSNLRNCCSDFVQHNIRQQELPAECELHNWMCWDC